MSMTHTTLPAQQDFERLFQRTRLRAYRLAYSLTGNADDAEDITQDAYVRAWRSFDHFDASHSFEAWLLRIVSNLAIDLYRRKRRHPNCSLDTGLPGNEEGQAMVHQFVAPDSDPQEIVIAPILEERLQKALTALPETYRTVVLLCDVQEYSYEEVAAAMGCPIGTVRSRMHRARELLRSYLDVGSRAATFKSHQKAAERDVFAMMKAA